jgi:hypothetical protein
MGMTLGRQIFEATLGKILLPWINLGFLGAVCTLASETLEGLLQSLTRS